jgi:predicted permease
MIAISAPKSATDVHYALRSLRSSPALTSVAVATFVIGIGAATAMFAVVDSVLLEPLAYPDADELVAIVHRAPGSDLLPTNGAGDVLASDSMFFTYAEENRVFDSIGIWTPGAATVTGGDEPEELPRVAVSAGVLETLGVPPLHGRWFGTDELAAGAGLTVMLGHGYWQRRFGGDSAVVGRTLNVNAQLAEVIGVMPPGFRIAGTDADLLLPLRFDRSSLTLPPFAYNMLARLKAGVTIETADADIARMLPIWLEAWPSRLDSAEYAEVARIAPAVRPLKQEVVGEVGEMLWLVMAAIGVVLLIACANVANLMLIRAAARRHELAIRAVLGASKARLSRVLLFEGSAVALAGGLVGVAVAGVALRALTVVAPENLPRLGEIGLDAGTIALSLVVASLMGFAVGIVSAAKTAGTLVSAVHVGGRSYSEGRAQRRVRQLLVMVQVALAVVVLICAGLLIRTGVALLDVDPGFTDAEQVQTLRIALRAGQIGEPVRVALRQREIVEALATVPGVSAVGFASSLPLDELNRFEGGGAIERLEGAVELEGRVSASGSLNTGLRRFKNVSPGFFAAVGTPLLAGRDLSWGDLDDDRPVVLISENMARELWNEPAAAIGQRLRQRGDARWREVIGVVADVREDGLHEPAPPIVYWPSLRRDISPTEATSRVYVSRSVIIAVRSRLAGTEAFDRQVREAVWSVDSNLPLMWVRTLEDIYERSLARTTFTLVMLVVAAGTALALGIVGLYGVLSYDVSLRRREIAIRLALGAQQRTVRGQFVRQGVALAAAGLALGMIVAAALARLMSSLLYGVEPLDPLTYAAVAAGLIAAAAVASYLPAQRASAGDPAESLAAD